MVLNDLKLRTKMFQEELDEASKSVSMGDISKIIRNEMHFTGMIFMLRIGD